MDTSPQQQQPVVPMDTSPVVTSIPSQQPVPLLPAIALSSPQPPPAVVVATPETTMVPAVVLTPPSTPAPTRQVSWPLPEPLAPPPPPLVVHDPSWTFDEEDALKKRIALYRERGLSAFPWHSIRHEVPELGRFSTEQIRAKFDQLQPLVPKWAYFEEVALIKRIKRYKKCGLSDFPWAEIRLDDPALNRFTEHQIRDKFHDLERIAPIQAPPMANWTPALVRELIETVPEVRAGNRIKWPLVRERNAKLREFSIAQLQSKWCTVQKSLKLY